MNIDTKRYKDNPLQYDIHPLDFCTKKTIEWLENALNSDENGLSSSEKIHRESLDEAYWGNAYDKEKLDEFWREFREWCFPW